MDCKRMFLLVAVSILAYKPLQAQEKPNPWKYIVEVSGKIAPGRVYQGATVLGKGPDYGGGVAFRPFRGPLRALSLEFQVAELHGDQPPDRTFRSRMTAFTGAWHFRPDSRFQFYPFLGFGHMRARYSRYCDTCVFIMDPGTGKLIPIPEFWKVEGSKNGLVLGGGFRIGLLRHLSFRPEVTVLDTTPGSGYNWAWMRISAGIGISF